MKVILVIIFLELLSAIFGLKYISKNLGNIPLKYFVWFLFFTVGIEVFGFVPRCIRVFESIAFLKTTFLAKNYWLYNLYFILSYMMYVYYFRKQLVSARAKLFLKYALFFYGISCVGNLCLSNIYFTSYASYTFMMGSFLVFISIGMYYLEMLNSDTILRFDRTISFYISIGALVFHLVTTPLAIYSKYFKIMDSPDFVNLYRIIFHSANVFMYTCYIVGFIICSKKIKSY